MLSHTIKAGDIHDHPDGVCAELPQWNSLETGEGAIAGAVGVSAGTPLVAFANTFRLSSNPTARTTIYLDFDGHTTTGTPWNNSTMGPSFYSPAYNTDGNVSVFSNSELTQIQQIWQRVANDFAPFDVNVTTLAPPDDWLIKSSANDPNYGTRVVITSYGPSSSTAGGIAYIDSFNWNSATPCFVYNTGVIGVSEAVSHEVGHTLGLSHDGT
ncbi:MAG: zinc-dependent metalloprotease family protein, partial [Cyanobium sp.]